MLKRLLILMFVSVLALPLATAVFAQTAPAKSKEGRVEGAVVRTSADKSTITVRKLDTTVETMVQYDSSTQWVSQEHGSKKVNNIDASQVKEGDRVICKGAFDDKGVLKATLISKRLSHPAE